MVTLGPSNHPSLASAQSDSMALKKTKSPLYLMLYGVAISRLSCCQSYGGRAESGHLGILTAFCRSAVLSGTEYLYGAQFQLLNTVDCTGLLRAVGLTAGIRRMLVHAQRFEFRSIKLGGNRRGQSDRSSSEGRERL